MRVIRIRFACSVLTVLSLWLIAPVLAGPGRSLRARQSPPLLVAQAKGVYELALAGAPAFYSTTRPIANARLIEVPNCHVLLALWDQVAASGEWTHRYAISLDGERFVRVSQASYELGLSSGPFDPLAGVPPVEPRLAADGDVHLFIVQFVTQPLAEFRAQIEQLGGTVRMFLANHAHVVRMGPTVRDAVAALPYVRWVGPMHPAYRLEESLRDNAARGAELFPQQAYNIMLLNPEPGERAALAQRITELGGRDVLADVSRIMVRATLRPEQLFEVIRWDEVIYVDRWMSGGPDMDLAREIGGVNFIENTLGFTGQGVRGEVMDGGYLATHVDLQSYPAIMHTTWPNTPDYHGTASMGVLFGDGTGNPQARGLLPDAQPIWASYLPVIYGTVNRFTHTAELVDPNGPYRAVFQSNGWGHMTTSMYNTISAEMDDILFRNDILVTNAQGNEGNSLGGFLSRPEAWAKNIVAVGGVMHRGTLAYDDDCWGCELPIPPPGASIFHPASHGPASDGRQKPDLTHFYDRTLTAWDTCNACYEDFLGTSNATALTAGHFGLLLQMWHEQVFPGHGGGATVFDSRPHMTTPKAMMINFAYRYDWHAGGPNNDLWRGMQGWGMADLRPMYELRDKMLIIDETDLLTNLQSRTYEVVVEPGEPELKVTLVYADPMGHPWLSQQRINDLTLKVVSPSNAFYYGNYGLWENNWSEPGGSPNTKDTVENVFIRNPEPGTWRVEVRADEINEDGHLETTELDADFALVVSGIVSGGCRGDLDGDGDVDLDDLPHFVDALLGNPPAHPGIDQSCADMNNDGDRDGDDIQPFAGKLIE